MTLTFLDQLKQLIGISATQKLCLRLSGARIFIPSEFKGTRRQQHEFRRIAAVIGQEKAEAIYSVFRGERIVIPRNTADLIQERNNRIIAAFDKGMTIDQLCQRYKLARRTIERVLSGKLPTSGALKNPSLRGRFDSL